MQNRNFSFGQIEFNIQFGGEKMKIQTAKGPTSYINSRAEFSFLARVRCHSFESKFIFQFTRQVNNLKNFDEVELKASEPSAKEREREREKMGMRMESERVKMQNVCS